jgi:hypothetical protein
VKGHVWQPAAHIRRSLEDPEVWVPYIPDGLSYHYEHAGLIRKVKHYVVEQLHRDDERSRWIRKGDDAWEFQALRPVPEEAALTEEEDDVHPYDYHNPELRRVLAVGLGLVVLVLVVRWLRRR